MHKLQKAITASQRAGTGASTRRAGSPGSWCTYEPVSAKVQLCPVRRLECLL